MATIVKKFNVATTGALPAIPLARPASKHSMQVKGIGGTVTSFSVTLEGSLDGVNFTVMATATVDGATVPAVEKTVNWVRGNVGSLVLGTATSINVFVAATDD